MIIWYTLQHLSADLPPSLSLNEVSGVMASIHACWWVHQKQWEEMVSCLLLSKMHFIFLNSKVLLFLAALPTTKGSEIPPFPIKTWMVNELFLETERFPPPRKQNPDPLATWNIIKRNSLVAWVNTSCPHTNFPYKLYPKHHNSFLGRLWNWLQSDLKLITAHFKNILGYSIS